MSLESLCNDTAEIKRQSTTANAGGGWSGAIAVVYGNVPCTIQPASGSTTSLYQQRQIVVSHTLYTTQSLDLVAGDTVHAADGRVFEVKDFGDMAGRGVATRVHLQKIG